MGDVADRALNHPRENHVAVLLATGTWHPSVGDTGPSLQGEVNVGDSVLFGGETGCYGLGRVVSDHRLPRHDVGQLGINIAQRDCQVEPLQDRWVGLLDAEEAVTVLDEE